MYLQPQLTGITWKTMLRKTTSHTQHTAGVKMARVKNVLL